MAQNIKTIAPHDPEWPALLREIPLMPKQLNIWGAIPRTKHYLSIVGTRRNSAYGEEITRNIIAGLAPYDFTIVSGMARGIDTIAHRAALENNMPTIAVLGCGLDKSVIFPQSNWGLAQDIAAHGGAVISEYDHLTKATLWTFPQRNRIISGLSPVTLVVEAPVKSGSLITAQSALEQNRDVCAIPGSAFTENAKGVNLLIKQGAHLVESAEDILNVYNIMPNASVDFDALTLSPEEKIIFDALSEPHDIDSLIRSATLPPHEAQAIIMMMELRGIIKKVGTEYIKNI